VFIEFGKWKEKRKWFYGIENDDGDEENSEAIGVKMEKGDYCNCIVATDLATYCSPIWLKAKNAVPKEITSI